MTPPAATAAAPVASVIVLAYRAAPFIRRSLQSLRQQTLAAPFEVIVVWSGDDATPALVAAEFPEARLVGGGQRLLTGAARNLGLAHARAGIVAFLAADCEAAPDWLERRIAAHREGYDLVGGAVVWAEPANAVARAGHLLEYNSCLPGRPREVSASPVYNLSFRREVFDRYGRYDESLPCGEDTALVWALCEAGAGFLYDPAIRIAHASATDVVGFCRHQAWHGYWLGRLTAGRQVPGIGGGVLVRLAKLLVLYPAGRIGRMWRRILDWQRDLAGQAALLTPLMLLGVAAATVGLVRGRLASADRGGVTQAAPRPAGAGAAPGRASPPA